MPLTSKLFAHSISLFVADSTLRLRAPCVALWFGSDGCAAFLHSFVLAKLAIRHRRDGVVLAGVLAASNVLPFGGGVGVAKGIALKAAARTQVPFGVTLGAHLLQSSEY